jgi:hypothetical protein
MADESDRSPEKSATSGNHVTKKQDIFLGVSREEHTAGNVGPPGLVNYITENA